MHGQGIEKELQLGCDLRKNQCFPLFVELAKNRTSIRGDAYRKSFGDGA